MTIVYVVLGLLALLSFLTLFTLGCFVAWAVTGRRRYVALGAIPDVVVNLTVGWAIWGRPARGQWTVSQRLKDARHAPGWRGLLASGLAAMLDRIMPGHIKE